MKTVIGKGKFLRLVREGKWEFVERVNARGVVAVIAITANRRLILTEQFRPAVGCQVIDLPAGLAGDVKGQEGEAFFESAKRELSEETGYDVQHLEQVADCPTSPGLTSEKVALFMASGLCQTHAGGGVDDEKIDVHVPALRGIDKWLQEQVAEGKMIDGKVYAGLYFAKRRQQRGNDSREE